jgi:DNA-binding response OmpR family regulator
MGRAIKSVALKRASSPAARSGRAATRRYCFLARVAGSRNSTDVASLSDIEFRILGPLEVTSEGGILALGGAKPRTVLAMLLLHPNEPISAERLALALWGDAAPADAVKTVHVHVSRLRKALRDGNALTTAPAGYSLRVLPGELDAERFARLVAEG